MNKRLKQLHDRKAATVAQMRKMSETLAEENRNAFTEEEEKAFGELKTLSSDCDRSIVIETAIMEEEKKLATIATATVDPIGDEERKIEEARKKNKTLPIHGLSRARTKNWRPLPGESYQDMLGRAYAAGQFLLAICSRDPNVAGRSEKWCRDNGISLLAQNETTNVAGGILVPDVLADQIIILREQYGVFRRFAKEWPMTSDNLTIPRRASGTTAYFVSDGVATTESQLGWDGVTLAAKELACLVRYPNTLNEDAVINIADPLSGEIADQFSYKEDLCGLLGDGTSLYGGIVGLNNACVSASIFTPASGSGYTSFGALILGHFESMVATLPQYAAQNACWFFSRAGYAASAQRLMDAGGGNTNETLAMGGRGNFQEGQDAYARPYRTFLGFPVIISQVVNSTLGAQASAVGVCYFGDLSLSSALGSRKEIAIDASKDRYFEFRQIGIQGVERFDIKNHDCGGSAQQIATATAGPIVMMNLPGS